MILNFFLQSGAILDSINRVNNGIVGQDSATENISYLTFVLKGGVLIIPIILLLFFCVYVIIERFIFIKKAVKQSEIFIGELRLQLKTGQVSQAIQVCSNAGSASGNILKSGISIIGRPVSEIESVMEKTANIEIAQMEKGLGYLGLISGIAPILGFIGTISGVIKIFYTISQTENISIGGISGGLYEKMISSGAGLVVGVVAYSAYHLFNMIIDNFSLNVQKQILEIINIIQEPTNGN